MAPPAKVTKSDSVAASGSPIETKVRGLLSNPSIFQDTLPIYLDKKNQKVYSPLTGLINTLQDYISGKAGYKELKAKIEAWAASSIYDDEVNQTARLNLIKILEGMKGDSDLKTNAGNALLAIKANSKDLSANIKPKVEAKAPSAPAAPPPPSAPPPAVKSSPVDLKQWRDAQTERDQKLSDQAIGWTGDAPKKYPTVSFAIIKVRDYLAGRETDAHFVRSYLLKWRENSNFESDPVLKTTYANLIKALESVSAEKNKERAPEMLKRMKEVDTAVAAYFKSEAAPAAPKKGDAPAKPAAPKKDVPPAKPAAPVAPPPASPSLTGAALLSDPAVFGDLLSKWNEPSNKSGQFFTLNVALGATRDFLDGKTDYKTLKQKLASWESSATYKEGLSYRARTNMIAILSGVKEGPLATKAAQALMALKTTKEIEAPKAPEPVKPPAPAAAKIAVVPVTYQEIDVMATGAVKGGDGSETADSFKSKRTALAVEARNAHETKIKKPFRFFGEVYLTPDSKTGEVSKITFKYVSAWKVGDSTENLTATDVSGYLQSIADAYRRDVKFKSGTGPIAFRLKDIRPSTGIPELTSGEVTDPNSLTKTGLYVLPKNASAPVKGAAAAVPPAPPPAPPPKAPEPPPPAPPPAPKKSDPVKGTYEFTYTSGHPDKESRSVTRDNANARIQSLTVSSRKLFERYKAQDESLTMTAKVLIEVDQKTGFVTKVTFTDVKVSSSMTGKIAQDVMQRMAESLHSGTRWVEDKDLGVVKIPKITWQ